MTQVAVEGGILSYQELGSGKKTPVLILHGWGRTGAEWIKVGQELALWSGRKVYVLDLPGFGGSSLSEVKDICEYSGWVVNFCKYLGLKKVIVVGHSLGGRVGIVMGAIYSEMVEKLILLDSAGIKPRSTRRVVLKVIAKMFGWIPAKLRHKIAGKVMDEDYHNSPLLRKLYRAIVREDLIKYLPKIDCETVVVWGENDRILPLSMTKVYREKIKNSRVRVVWRAGHDPHLSHPDQTLAILQESAE